MIINFDLILNILEVIGIIAFSASGTFKGLKKEFDIFGIVVLALITATGGGIIRDTILNKIPNAIAHPRDLYISIITSVVIFFLAVNFRKRRHKNIEDINQIIYLVLFCDAIGLALFTTVGANAAINSGLGILGIGVIATITGIGGGMMRDILANEVPYILKEDIYATLAFGGGILYYLLIFNLGFSSSFAIVIVFVILLTIRLLAMKYKLNLRNASADKYRSWS